MRTAGSFKRIYAHTMVGIYFLAGLFLILNGWYILSGIQNYGIGGMLIVYAGFRLYRLRQDQLTESEETMPGEEQEI